MFVVVEPSWNIHPAPVHPGVGLLHLPDGQGHVALLQVAQQQVTLRQAAGHGRPVRLDHFAGAASAGDGPPAPADRQLPVVLAVVVADQGHVRPHRGDDAVRAHAA